MYTFDNAVGGRADKLHSGLRRAGRKEWYNYVIVQIAYLLIIVGYTLLAISH